MRFTKTFCILMLVLGLSGQLYAQTTGRGEELVNDLRIDGLKRTQPAVVERLLARFMGRRVDDIDLDDVDAILRQTGLFSRTEAAIQFDGEEAPVLTVSVEEKWTILPIPMFFAGSDGIVFGGTVMDMNAFGLGDKAFLGGLYSSNASFGFASYMHAPDSLKAFGWSISTAYSSGETNVEDAEENTLLPYGEDAVDLSLGLTRKLNNLFSLETNLGFKGKSVDGDAVDSMWAVPISIGFAARWKPVWDGVFLSQRSVFAKATYSAALQGDSFSSVSGRAEFAHSIVRGLRLVSQAGAFKGIDVPVIFMPGQMETATALFSKDFRSASLAGASLGLEQRIADLKIGLLSATFSYQIATVEDIRSERTFAHGPSWGLRFYLAKLAVPAMEFGTVYNVESGDWKTIFGLGMRM